MAKVQEGQPLDPIRGLGVEEIAIGKGPTYWTMLSAVKSPRGPELLIVVKNRGEKNLKKFWKWFGKERERI
ncbi:MAG: hypothetical protein JNK54_03225 [Elusimicrobia bacterium]|jgi:hypothetical protein|nr:hypothetical protein [Elusimicrobiota bacterium]